MGHTRKGLSLHMWRSTSSRPSMSANGAPSAAGVITAVHHSRRLSIPNHFLSFFSTFLAYLRMLIGLVMLVRHWNRAQVCVESGTVVEMIAAIPLSDDGSCAASGGTRAAISHSASLCCAAVKPSSRGSAAAMDQCPEACRRSIVRTPDEELPELDHLIPRFREECGTAARACLNVRIILTLIYYYASRMRS